MAGTKDLPRQTGVFGDPSMDLQTDPRTNQTLLSILKPFGLAARVPPPPFVADCPQADILTHCKTTEEGLLMLYDNVPYDVPGDEKFKTTKEVKTIKGAAGQDMKLFITRPEGAKGELPGVVYTHGGGMTICPADNKILHNWCHDIAVAGTGSVVIEPEFRNAYDSATHKFIPFPAGLDDCVAAFEWVAAHKSELGISKLIVHGESGGGNLATAVALKLKREGKLDLVDGVYAIVPYVSGAYGWPKEKLLQELPSLVEFDGYFLNMLGMHIMARAYGPEDQNRENPLAWPYHATEEDLKGLPPFTVVVDELDPLRDEGMALVRKLDRAGVRVNGRVNLGTTHAAPLLFRSHLPDMRFPIANDIVSFANRV